MVAEKVSEKPLKVPEYLRLQSDLDPFDVWYDSSFPFFVVFLDLRGAFSLFFLRLGNHLYAQCPGHGPRNPRRETLRPLKDPTPLTCSDPPVPADGRREDGGSPGPSFSCPTGRQWG